ncbi:hypothetical protein DMS64_13425 [Klebsiella variicola]|uniref:Uncharacterized protein n=2 Tax=Klebsiella variicola TaxID=244366 RepID=A0A2N4YS77_KLEVA|nr:hypothetical protein KPK_1951 [Klebsiella variicola]AYW19132.1 hypothetical protein DTA24_11035 [Klebsiella sp. P1CD1]MPT46369.1 hypothetical protein [Klebsiella sp.]NIG24366.1 hypothetical protein [Klebsiella sp. Acro-834]NIG38360.1 hypothetical protein [Klebsiella sp. Acro-833]NIG47441.1 hypothetical protein [Klebsiella sp. Ap-874]PJX61344.1 hypothetical protein CWM63_02150 [Klebsiella sp. F-Nf9]PJX66399.1 hypothetical protein CWM56_03560 [Klebsiella sp. E-Nf3]PKJ63757.1 hypothetical p
MIACTFMRLCRSWQGVIAFANITWLLPHYCNFFTIAQQLRFVQVCTYTNRHADGASLKAMNIDAHNYS